jgi:hypothetical protein
MTGTLTLAALIAWTKVNREEKRRIVPRIMSAPVSGGEL